MVLESTVICIDNSEFMRNGDFMPNRLQAQQDAVQLVCNAKTRSNPENNIALMSLASPDNLQVHCTFTSDVNRVMSLLTQVQPNGDLKLLNGIKIAQLVLRHRQGKNHRQKIVLFVGSPVEENDKELTMLAKKLKKNNVNVNIVNFGEEANTEKLQGFVATLNQGKDEPGSHFVNVPSGSKLSDALLQSPVITEDGAMPGGGVFDPSGAGLDPNDDPELALALRVSMEEQRKQQQEDDAARTDTAAAPSAAETPAPAQPADNEEALLQQALSISMGGVPMDKDLSTMTEDEQIQLALRMSMQQDEPAPAGGAETPATSSGAAAAPSAASGAAEEEEMDVETLQAVLASLPGVDPNDPKVKEMLEQARLDEQAQRQARESRKKDDDKPEPMQ